MQVLFNAGEAFAGGLILESVVQTIIVEDDSLGET